MTMRKSDSIILKSLGFSFVFLVILSASTYATANLQVNPQLPNRTVLPGESIDLRIALTNNGTSGADSILYSIITGAEITGYSTGQIEVGGVPAGETRVIKVPLIISKTATNGTYAITVKVWYSGGRNSPIVKTIFVRVGSESSIHITNVAFDNKTLIPGRTSKVYVTLANVGKEGVYDISAKLEPNTKYIIPSLAGAEAYLGSLPENTTKNLEFLVSVDSEAETKTYEATLTLEYRDASGKSLSEVKTIGLPVSGTPKLEILNTEIEDNEFKIEIENLGTAKAKAIRVELIQNGKIMSVDVDNELKVDKHTTFRFSNYNKGVGTAHITYLDEKNKKHEDSVSVEVPSSSNEHIKIGIGTIVLILVVILESVYIYKMKKPKRHR